MAIYNIYNQVVNNYNEVNLCVNDDFYNYHLSRAQSDGD